MHERRRRSRAEAEQLLAEYEASGLSRVDLCRSHGMNLATLARYQKRQRQAARKTLTANRWVAVEVSGARSVPEAADSGLSIALPGGQRIEVVGGFDAATLEQLLRLLELV